MAKLPRGIAPELLQSQVKNTMPYLFDSPLGEELARRYPPARVLREYDGGPTESLTHFEYFRLCLSSHDLTVATPVPTDVDNQIRQKLWPKQLPLQTALQMADLVIESRGWDYALVTRRLAYGAAGTPSEREMLCGHHGEWFTVACGAYCAMGQYRDAEAQAKRAELFDQIAAEVQRHSEVFGALWRAGDGLGSLKAAAAIAHNMGDLDRVMDMWELDPGDPLRLGFYKLTSQPFDYNRKLRYLGRLWVAGELYKAIIDGSALALENHRHFALRKPKCLRRSPEFMIQTGPFFDDWGRKIARGLSSDETMEVVEALQHGWERMPKTAGYGRGLRGFLEVRPELRTGDFMKGHPRRAVLDMTQEKFEKRWADEALRLMDDIPSRAT